MHKTLHKTRPIPAQNPRTQHPPYTPLGLCAGCPPLGGTPAHPPGRGFLCVAQGGAP